MNAFDRTVSVLARATGAFQVLLGVLFWFGIGRQLVNVHMAVGLLFVLSLWALASRGFFAGAGRGVAAFAAPWGLLVLAFGMTHTRILPGPYHWVIQVLHLGVGIVAMGLADALARGIKRVGARSSAPGEAGFARAADGE